MTHVKLWRCWAVALLAVGLGMGMSADDELHPIDPLNSPFKENEASFSHDGHTVYFACYGRFGSAPTAADICVSHLTGKFEDMQWSEPEPVPFPITTQFNEQEPKISLDGKRLYFQSNRVCPSTPDCSPEERSKGGLDVWVSERGPSGEWQDPVSLPFPINTPFNDHCFYFDDMVNEDSGYLASNRPGTLGGNDLWYTVKIDGEWAAPVNLGPNINSPGNDHMAMVGPDGRLWVTSNRAGTMGGEDQWVSELDANGNWGPLRNLGAPWNSPSDDRCGDWTFKRGMGQMERSDDAGGIGSEIYFVFSSSRPEAPTNPSGAGNLDNYYARFDAVLESLEVADAQEDLGASRQAMQAPGGTLEEQLAATEVHHFPFPITSAETEVEASFSRNGHTMYFTCWGRSGAATLSDICVSHLRGNFENGQWTEPEVLSISSTSRDVEPKISPTGNRLFFQSDRPGGFGGRDIYYTDLVDGEWQPPVHLPAPINTRFEDHCLYFVDPMALDDFGMDATAYLASTRPGTLGSNDIWVTHRVNGLFSTPVNLGPPVNGKGNDHMAMEGPDGRLWVTSTKPGNLADEDLFVSEPQPGGSWGPLIDLGPPFNTPSREICVDFVHEMNTGPLTRSDDGSTHAMGNVIYGVFGSTRTDPGNAKFDLYYFRMDRLLRR